MIKGPIVLNPDLRQAVVPTHVYNYVWNETLCVYKFKYYKLSIYRSQVANNK